MKVLLTLVLINSLFALIKCDVLQFPIYRRQRQAIADEDLTGGDLAGAYFASVYIGTPPQHFELIIDTGSAYMVVIDRHCERMNIQCQGTSPGYDSTSSSTSKLVSCSQGTTCTCSKGQCVVEVVYGDGSNAVGDLYQDVVEVGNVSAVSYFGSMISATHDFSSQSSDGVLGLGYSSLSDGVPTFMDNVVSMNGLPNVFSMCFEEQNGVLIIGGTDPSYYSGNFIYTPIISLNYYVVNLQRMAINSQFITVGSVQYDTIIDSGTSGIVVPKSIYSQIMSAMLASCSSGGITQLCGTTNIFNTPSTSCLLFDSLQELNSLPVIIFQFQGLQGGISSVTIGGQNYMRKELVNGKLCAGLGIYSKENVGIVLGDTFMRTFYTVFDRQNSRIGFAPDNSCGSAQIQEFIDRASDCTLAYLSMFVVALILQVL
jgi:hypothetical protein